MAALRQLALLDTPAEEAFDRLTRLAARILRAPVSLVSLVDADRQFVKSAVGLPEPLSSAREMPLTHSFCHRTIELGAPLVIEDARRHPEFCDHPAVRLRVVSYAGIPLFSSDGYALGTLCVVDSRPRSWNTEGFELLGDLAASVMTEIELRRALRRAEQGQAEARRERSERLAVLERIAEGAVALDRNLRITFANPAAERLLGRSRAELVGLGIAEVLPEVALAGRYDALSGALTGGTPVHFDLQPRAQTWIEVHVYPSESGLWVYLRDISEQRRTEAALRSSEERLQQSQRLEAVGRLAGGIAHDFNNVLMVIRGHAELMLEALEAEDPLTEELIEIREAAERAAGLTRQLLAFSRRQVLQPKVVDLREVVEGMEKMLRRLLGEDVT
ncbi:MAG TPA: GAF domain-containing protein, partial [Longimicrobiales bacterium]